MKSYVENAFKDNQYRLICQYGGFSAREFQSLFTGNSFIAFELPKTQSLESVWGFRLYLASGEMLSFSAMCTGVGGWEEINSLRVDLKNNCAESDESIFEKTVIDRFFIASSSMLVYEKDDVYAECGICFKDNSGQELIVVAAPETGAVSVCVPSIDTVLEPEFALSDYAYKTIGSGK